MSSLVTKTANGVRRAYVPTSAEPKAVEFDDDMMHVVLVDGRVISVPILWFPLLAEASKSQRENYELGRIGIHWPEIDEDLSIAGLMAGIDEYAS